MPSTYTSAATQYDVLIHTNEFSDEFKNWIIPPNPQIGYRINAQKEGWVRAPWRCTLQHGGLKELKIVYGPEKAQQFREHMNSTPRDLGRSTAYGHNSTGTAFGAMTRLFTINKKENKVGIPDSLLDTKYSELADFNGDDYSVTLTQDWSLEGDGVKERIKSLGVLGAENQFRNPMSGISPAVPVQQRWHKDQMVQSLPAVYCCSFWPKDLNNYDQLFREWSQMGYIKFKDEELTIPKRGSKDIIFVSAPVDVAARNSDQPDGLPQARLMPGRPYELKTSSRTLLAHNSAVIIHLYRE